MVARTEVVYRLGSGPVGICFSNVFVVYVKLWYGTWNTRVVLKRVGLSPVNDSNQSNIPKTPSELFIKFIISFLAVVDKKF